MSRHALDQDQAWQVFCPELHRLVHVAGVLLEEAHRLHRPVVPEEVAGRHVQLCVRLQLEALLGDDVQAAGPAAPGLLSGMATVGELLHGDFCKPPMPIFCPSAMASALARHGSKAATTVPSSVWPRLAAAASVGYVGQTWSFEGPMGRIALPMSGPSTLGR